MAQYGVFDPTNSENPSSLFAYQEVPLASSKMNCWNGNIAALFEMLQEVCSALLAQGKSGIVSISDANGLKVTPNNPPGMIVRTNIGWAVIKQSFAGTKETQTIPQGETFPAPSSHPRIDLVVLHSTGELQAIFGEEAESPEPPSTPDDAIALAQIVQRVGATQVLSFDNEVQSYIIDIRPKLLLGEAHLHAEDHRPNESSNGSRVQFSTDHYFRAGTLDVFVNGILMENEIDYHEDEDCRGYTFLTPPLAHYRIQHRYVIATKYDE